MRKIIVAITGASGMLLPLKLMQLLALQPDMEIGCIVSSAARKVLSRETCEDEAIFWALAKHAWRPDDLEAGPASGTWWKRGDAMIVAPCSMSTLGAVASGCGSNLIHRCCDVALKEHRKLALITRESPLSLIHLRNMTALAEAGAIIMPFSPAYYFQPKNMDESLAYFCQRIFDLFDIAHGGPVWGTRQPEK